LPTTTALRNASALSTGVRFNTFGILNSTKDGDGLYHQHARKSPLTSKRPAISSETTVLKSKNTPICSSKLTFSKGKRNGPIKERHPIQTQISLSLLSPRLDSSKYSHSNTGMSFTENDRASTARRVSAGFPPDSENNVMGIQARRRRGTSKSKQVAPLQISVPPVAALYEVEGRFENPRKAPQPQGVAFNARQPGTGTPPATSPRMPSSNATTPCNCSKILRS